MTFTDRICTKSSKIANIMLWKTYSAQLPKPKIKTLTSDALSKQSGPVYEVTGDCYMQPLSGYVICDGHVIWESMHLNVDAPIKISTIDVPSFRAYRKAKRDKSQLIRIDEALSCRHFFEWNYYHFFMDVLPKVAVYEAAGISMDLPLVIGDYVNKVSFASQTISETGFNEYNWLNQDSSYIHANRIRFCRVLCGHSSRAVSNSEKFKIVDAGDANERIYLTRGVCTGRRVKNEDEVINIMKSLGFKVVDTNGMHVMHQAQLFKNARYVVAPHGAGLTNIQFRQNSPLSLLELHPYHRMTDFERICNGFGHHWSCIMGKADSKDAQHSDYWINPLELKHKVENLLAT
jgi:capsular polysaccharide biosynthesis protein